VRDIVNRVAELQEQNAQISADIQSMEADPHVSQTELDEAYDALEDFEYETNFSSLVDLLDEVKRIGPHYIDSTLIHDSYFTEHARQEAEDLGLISNIDQWPATCIDWDRAAYELKSDYLPVSIGDETYYVRM